MSSPAAVDACATCAICGMGRGRCPGGQSRPVKATPLHHGDYLLHCGFEFNLTCESVRVLRTFMDTGHLTVETFNAIVDENMVPGAFMFAMHYHMNKHGVDVELMRRWYSTEQTRQRLTVGTVKGVFLKKTGRKTFVVFLMSLSTNPKPVYCIIHDPEAGSRSRFKARSSTYDKYDDAHMHHCDKAFPRFSLDLVPYKVVTPASGVLGVSSSRSSPVHMLGGVPGAKTGHGTLKPPKCVLSAPSVSSVPTAPISSVSSVPSVSTAPISSVSAAPSVPSISSISPAHVEDGTDTDILPPLHACYDD